MAEDKTPILISLGALVLSCFALGWNVYRDVILKPRLKVRLMISFVLHGEYQSPDKISINATNFGPNRIRCESIHAKNAPLWRLILRKVEYAFIVDDYTDPYSTRLPCELEVGQNCKLFMPFEKDCLFAESFTHVGITDSFGRTHWAPKKDIVKARKSYKKKFSQNNQT